MLEISGRQVIMIPCLLSTIQHERVLFGGNIRRAKEKEVDDNDNGERIKNDVVGHLSWGEISYIYVCQAPYILYLPAEKRTYIGKQL